MINIFDLNTTMAGSKVLAEKAHQDGSPMRKVVSEMVKKALDPAAAHTDNKMVNQEWKQVNNTAGTPIKMLMEQEMLKELGVIQRKPAAVVAKLIGVEVACRVPEDLDQFLGSKTQKASGARQGAHSDRRIQKTYHDRLIRCDGYSFSARLDGSRGYRDVCEIPSRSNSFKNRHQPNSLCGGDDDVSNEKRMALLRQKFVEAKHLSAHEKLIQSKDFQDALAVLNSNKELFLNLIEESNSMISKQFSGIKESPVNPKRITVLKPSKQKEADVEEGIDKHFPSCENSSTLSNDSSSLHMNVDQISRPTRIVVLRPSPSMESDTKSLVASRSPSQRIQEEMDVVDELGDNTEMRGLEDENVIAGHSYKSFNRLKDEMCSVLSNGYNGDESSVNLSEDDDECMDDDEFHSFSDSDGADPSPPCLSRRHTDRSESHYSASCFSSPPPYSPVSTVVIEAKKRLSERLAKVSSNSKPNLERKLFVQKNISTLGEMLSAAKREDARDRITQSVERPQIVRGQEIHLASAGISGGGGDGCSSSCIENKSRGLSRSRSAPVLSPTREIMEQNDRDKSSGKMKRSKSLFVEKVSGFFSLRSKKYSQDRSSTATDGSSLYQEVVSCSTSSEASPHVSMDLSSGIPIRSSDQLSQDSLPLDKLGALDNAIGSPGQPSPVSVLESPFVDDINCNSSQLCESASILSHRGISRSPPIESVARTLSWECHGGAGGGSQISHHRRHSTGLFEMNAEEHERVMFVRDVLAAAGLDGETDCSVLTKWHPADTPLNPLLLDKLLGSSRGEDTRSRHRRAQQRLLFDCVSAALSELGLSYNEDRYPWCLPSPNCGVLNAEPSGSSKSVSEAVLGRIQELFSSEEKWWPCELSCRQAVDLMVRKEMVGGVRWSEMGEAEVGELGKGIEAMLMEELLDESLDDFISCWS